MLYSTANIQIIICQTLTNRKSLTNNDEKYENMQLIQDNPINLTEFHIYEILQKSPQNEEKNKKKCERGKHIHFGKFRRGWGCLRGCNRLRFSKLDRLILYV